MICVFIISFVFVAIARIILTYVFYIDSVTLQDLGRAFVHFRMVGEVTWYIKVQILFYIISAIAFIIVPSRYRNVCILILTMVYVAVAKIFNLADYWWKTAMCFPMGALFAQYRDRLYLYIRIRKEACFGFFTVLAMLAYIWILFDKNQVMILQLVAFAILGITISMLGSILQISWKPLCLLGKASLPIYLVHVGLAASVLGSSINTNIKVSIFIILTVCFSVMVYFLDSFVTKQMKNFRRKFGGNLTLH